MEALYGFFEEAKSEGLIRNIVFSSHMQGNDIENVVETGKFKGMLIGYNALNYQFRQSGIRKAYIVAYDLGDKEYKNFFTKVQKERIQLIPIEYDEDFIKKEYLPKLQVLTVCLERGVFPCSSQDKYQM